MIMLVVQGRNATPNYQYSLIIQIRYDSRFPDFELYIDSLNNGAAARFMTQHCIGNAVLELNTAGCILLLAVKHIQK